MRFAGLDADRKAKAEAILPKHGREFSGLTRVSVRVLQQFPRRFGTLNPVSLNPKP